MIRRAAIVLALTLGGCAGGPGGQHAVGRAPDAVLTAEGKPGDQLAWTVVRPTVWMTDEGKSIVDDRITLAVLDRDTATWRAAARLNDLEALSLIDAIEQAVGRRSSVSPAALVVVELHEVPANLGPTAVVAVAGGAWQVTPTDEALIHLDLVDETGHAHVRVVTDVLSAKDLGRRLALIVRGAG